MKRFCVFHDILPHGRMEKIPWLMDNFDFVEFTSDVRLLDEYELIYIYQTGQEHPNLKEKKVAKYLREHGVSKPKILYQRDYYRFPLDEFPEMELLNYVNAIAYVGNRKWNHLPKQTFYIQFPLFSDEKVWIPYKDKIMEAVTIRRHNTKPTESKKLAELIDIPLNILRENVETKTGSDYIEYLSKHILALDYHDNYFGWSRFVAECTNAGTPIFGPIERLGVMVANDEFCGEYASMVDKIEKLMTDEDYYNEARQKALDNISEHLSPETCGERIKEILLDMGIEF